MRILLVTDWNRGRGGAEGYMSLLRDGLRGAGDEVRLLTSSAGTAGDGTADYVAFGTENLAAQTILQIANPFAVVTLKRALAELRPHVVFVNMFAHHLSPAVLTALRNVPTVLLITDYKCVCPIGSKLLPNESICNVRAGWVCCRDGCINALHWLRDRPRYAWMDAGIRRVEAILTCSQWMQQMLARDGISAEPIMLPVVEPSTDFRHAPAAEPLFVFCGRLDREKGVGLLLRAFAALRFNFPNAQLRIIGRGPLRANLETLAHELGVAESVEFCGWLALPQIEEELARASALVVPSIWAEPLGLVAAEAIVRGVPVIASLSGGLAEIVEEGVSGLLFPTNDAAALIERMAAIASGEKFPNHGLTPDVIVRSRHRFGIEEHLIVMREVFRRVAGL